MSVANVASLEHCMATLRMTTVIKIDVTSSDNSTKDEKGDEVTSNLTNREMPVAAAPPGAEDRRSPATPAREPEAGPSNAAQPMECEDVPSIADTSNPINAINQFRRHMYERAGAALKLVSATNLENEIGCDLQDVICKLVTQNDLQPYRADGSVRTISGDVTEVFVSTTAFQSNGVEVRKQKKRTTFYDTHIKHRVVQEHVPPITIGDLIDQQIMYVAYKFNKVEYFNHMDLENFALLCTTDPKKDKKNKRGTRIWRQIIRTNTQCVHP